MFKIFEKSTQEQTHLQKEIDRLLSEMENLDPASEEYKVMAANLAMIYKLQETDKPDRISKDALLAAGVTLSVALLVLYFEKSNVVTSKAFSYIGRMFR